MVREAVTFVQLHTVVMINVLKSCKRSLFSGCTTHMRAVNYFKI